MTTKQRAPFAEVTLWITAAIWLCFGILLSIYPDWLVNTFQGVSGTPAMKTEIRAFQGGVEIGISVTMILFYVRDKWFEGLLVGGIPLAFSACGRAAGNLIDGLHYPHLMLMAFEIFGAVLCFIAAKDLSKTAPRSQATLAEPCSCTRSASDLETNTQ